jgi:midasin (ATPase involved in ribosome maturation)
LKCQINPESIYDEYFKNQNLEKAFKEIPILKGIPSLIITQNLKRLAVLVHKCLQNKEPVLLVGETGCGKTSLC